MKTARLATSQTLCGMGLATVYRLVRSHFNRRDGKFDLQLLIALR